MTSLILKKNSVSILILICLLSSCCYNKEKELRGIDGFKDAFGIATESRFLLVDIDICSNCMATSVITAK